MKTKLTYAIYDEKKVYSSTCIILIHSLFYACCAHTYAVHASDGTHNQNECNYKSIKSIVMLYKHNVIHISILTVMKCKYEMVNHFAFNLLILTIKNCT